MKREVGLQIALHIAFLVVTYLYLEYVAIHTWYKKPDLLELGIELSEGVRRSAGFLGPIHAICVCFSFAGAALIYLTEGDLRPYYAYWNNIKSCCGLLGAVK